MWVWLGLTPCRRTPCDFPCNRSAKILLGQFPAEFKRNLLCSPKTVWEESFVSIGSGTVRLQFFAWYTLWGITGR